MPVAVPFTGGIGKQNTLTDTVPALGRTDYEVSDASAPIQSGWAQVTAGERHPIVPCEIVRFDTTGFHANI